MKKITIQQIIKEKKPTKLRALFSFCLDDPTEAILLKFNLWSRYFFLQYFTSKDADFHEEMDTYNLQAYQGSIDSFTNLAFRGAAKTSRVKLFIAYMIANDRDKYRRYIKVLSEEGGNSRQIVTDVYNMLVSPRVRRLYPEIFQKTAYKREERMSSFTTATGIKLLAGSVGTDQRGALQEEARPDLILFEDFETRKTLRSAKITQAIWDNMEEARTSLAKEGSCIYNGNYISEMGNVHRLVEKRSERNIVMITPILKNGKSTWDRYTLEDIEQMRKTDDDFEGERLCVKPDTLIKTPNGFKEIRKIKVGDMVFTHKGNKKKVLNVFKSNRDDLLDITINNKKITITKNHPVFVKRNNKKQWVEAGMLKKSDLIIYENNNKTI